MREVNRPDLTPSLTSPGSPGAFLFPSASRSPLTAQAEAVSPAPAPALGRQPSALPCPCPRPTGRPLALPCPALPLPPALGPSRPSLGRPSPAVSPSLALPSASPRPSLPLPRHALVSPCPLPFPDRPPALPRRSARSGGRQPYFRKPPGMIDLRRRPASAGQGSPGAPCPPLKHRRRTLDYLILIT